MRHPGITIGAVAVAAFGHAGAAHAFCGLTPPMKKIQSVGFGALLGVVLCSAGLLISRRFRRTKR